MAALIVVGFSSSGQADQADVRLNPLFDTLRMSERAAEAEVIRQQIWGIWFETTDAAVTDLMADGERAMRRGDGRSALAAFDQVVVLAPDFAEGWNRRATVHYQLNNLQESLADIDATLALEPRHFGALSGRGLVFIKLQEFEQALAAFEEALAVSPHMTGARSNADAIRELLGVRDI
ncbi:MAG: tetratricopeptide repeat protein [Alphaproteobacteria bacterium]